MSRAKIYLKNLAANYVGYGANLLVMFFMSPFVVKALGDVEYGVWTLMISLTGYLGLVELGTRAGIGRYINYYLGKQDIQSVNAIISTGLAILAGVGVVLGVTSAVIALSMHLIFPKIPVELLHTARSVSFLIAANLWVAFLSVPFKQVLQAFERFEISNGVDLLVLVVRSTGTVVVLLAGHGLVALAEVQLVSSVLGLIGVYWTAHRVFPNLRVRISLVSWYRFRELFGFSVWAFAGDVAWKLLYSADNIVIAILLGPKWVTYYSVGGILLIRARELVSQAISIFVPQMLKDCACNDWPALRIAFRRGSNLSMAVGILVFVGMIAFGREFLILWMGPEFDISYTILLILAVSSLPAVAFSVCGAIYEGLNRVRLSAILTLLQGLANLGLTLLFVLSFDMGIKGVAWGTFYPRIGFSILCGIIAMRWIHIPIVAFYAKVVSRWLLLAVVFLAVCWTIDSVGEPGHWMTFFGKVAAACAAYLPLAWLILPEKQDRAWFIAKLTDKLSRRAKEVPHNVSAPIEEY
jgi:O-antigen/teichoic acid export membrane protein